MLLFYLLSLLLSFLPAASALWPLPLNSKIGTQVVWLSPDFEVIYNPQNSTGVLDQVKSFLMCVLNRPVEEHSWLMRPF